MRRDGRTEWCPDCAEQKQNKLFINPGYRNEEKQFIGTVDSTARMLNMLAREQLSQEEFNKALDKNANHIGVDTDLLLSLAEQTLQEKESPKEA